MNRILQAEVILTLTCEQAEWLVEMCHLMAGRVVEQGSDLGASAIGKTTGVIFAQCAKQGVQL